LEKLQDFLLSRCVKVSPVGGDGFRSVELANPKGKPFYLCWARRQITGLLVPGIISIQKPAFKYKAVLYDGVSTHFSDEQS
jgi:hypothetical protein